MFNFLQPKKSAVRVPADKVMDVYKKYRLLTLIGIIIGYASFYVVRNNFALSTPFLKADLNLSATSIGLLSSYMLISYGLSKGYMSSLADKADPKKFMALGYPKKERGIVGAFWNISHNIGGGIVAPVVTAGFFIVGEDNWQAASYIVPACVALIGVVVVLYCVKGSPVNEGLPDLQHIMPEDDNIDMMEKNQDEVPENMSAWKLFKTYVLPNKNAWFVSFVDTFVYTVRFGMLTWLPIYLLQVKGFTKAEMAVAFLFFEWAAIPSTIFAGVISDKFFKGYRMPPAIISMILIFFCIIGYWKSESLATTTIFAAIVGCLIYIPQFLASVQTMEIVPSYAVGSAVGLRGFMSYVVGASIGTSLFGVAVDHIGWDGGFYILFAAVILCILFCLLTHHGAKQLHKESLERRKEKDTVPVSPSLSH